MPGSRVNFALGRINKDIDNRLLQNGEYRDALNIQVSSSEGSDVGAIENCLGNEALTELSLGANAVTVGSGACHFNNKLYWLVKSDTGSYFIEYDPSSDTSAFVLQDTRSGANSVLNLNTSYLVTDIDFLIDSDNNEILCFFTDNLNQPRCINIERAKTYGVNGFDEEDIVLVKKPPIYPPSITLDNTASDEENNIKEKFLRFFYRYKYLDGEYSAFSPLSETAFLPEAFNYDYSTQTNESMVNTYNKVTIGFNTGSDLVTDVEILFKESGSNATYLIERYNKTNESWADDTTQSIDFVNNKIYKQLPEEQLKRLYDAVPLKAQSQEMIGNRIAYGNYTANYDIADSNGDPIYIDIEAGVTNTAITEGTATQSMKSIRDYELGIAYGDEYGRLTTVLTSEGNTVYIPVENCDDQNKLQLTINHEPPAFATFYRVFLKQNRVDYDQITPSIFYDDGVYTWIRLEGKEVQKINEGDFLYVKADTQNVLSENIQVKVLEIKDQPTNFLDEDAASTVNVAGKYFRIKVPQGVSLSEADFVNYDFYAYDSSKRVNSTPINDEANVIEPAVYYGTDANGLNDLEEGGTYTGTEDIRYIVEILNEAVQATGSVELTGGGSGSVDGITVNGVQIMSGAVSFNSTLDQTATDVAANITAHTSTPNYTATAVGAVITITSETPGSAVNGFVVTSTTTTITTTDTNMSGGINDTFQWSNDDGFSYDDNGGGGYEIDGTAQAIEEGITATFGAVIGHDKDDNWIISAKYFRDDEFGLSETRKGYAFFKGLPSNGNVNVDDRILAGSVITMTYKETGEETGYETFTWIASREYANLEEWWYGDNAQDDWTIGATRIWFRRGTVESYSGESNDKFFTQDDTGDMTMIIRSDGTRNTGLDGNVFVRAWTSITYSEQRVIFETKPEDLNQDIFYEIGRTYDIVGGYHIGAAGDTDQSSGVSAILTLPVFNCFAWGNGFESYKIRDEYNAKSLKIDTRPLTYIDDYKQNNYIASITYGGVYEQTTNYNALNEFNYSLLNYRDFDDSYGGIQKLYARDTDLIMFQENKIHNIPYRKDILLDATGNTNVTKSDEVLGTPRPYAGEYGISLAPESFAYFGNRIYLMDAKRGVPLRLSIDGVTEINLGVSDFFKDIFINDTFQVTWGGYDPYNDEYIISVNDGEESYSIGFSESVRGWTSRYSYVPESMVGLNNRFYSFKEGQLYLHNSENVERNNFYGEQYSSKVRFVFNEMPESDKIFKTMTLEGDASWSAVYSTNYTNGTLSDSEFNSKESRWFAYLRKNENNSDLRSVAQGIGTILTSSGLTVTVGDIPNNINYGDKLYQLNVSTQQEIGTIQSISGSVITVTSIVNAPVNGAFAFSKKDSRIEGSEIRGYYLDVELENNSTTAIELFAVETNMVKSYV